MFNGSFTIPPKYGNQLFRVYTFLIHNFCKVMGSYHSTQSMLDSMLTDFRVGDDTKHFRRTKTAIKLQAEARLDSLYSNKSNPTAPRRTDLVTPSVVKPSRQISGSFPRTRRRSSLGCRLPRSTECIFTGF